MLRTANKHMPRLRWGRAAWFIRTQPSCYCHACGQCSHVATYRFPARLLNSCEACLVCDGSRYLWGDRYGDGQVPSSAHFRMGLWYRLRAALSVCVHLVACRIDPNSKDYRNFSRPTWWNWNGASGGW
jgi:hypothetical protein